MNSDTIKDRIRIVLVETTHPGNIGSSARAMKTMGLRDLRLVSPVSFPSPDARALASGADDIIDNAKVTESLPDAIGECQLVVGVSARIRGISLPVFTPDQAVPDWLLRVSEHQHVALLFGREDRGLTNEELKLCHQQIHIASDPLFSSLNLASAVQVVCYEIRKQFLQITDQQPVSSRQHGREHPKAGTAALEHFYAHLEETMESIEFFKHSSRAKIMAKLRRLYNRSEPDEVELNILRGILTETQVTASGCRHRRAKEAAQHG